MRLPSVPGPRDVLAAGELFWSMLPRVGALIDEAEALLGRMGGLLEDVDRTRRSADDVVGRAAGTVDRVGDTVTRADETVAAVAGTVVRAEETVDLAAALLATTTAAVDRLVVLLDSLEPSLTRLQPTLERLAQTTDPREVDAMVQLVDHLPGLVTQLERDVLPILTSLGTVAPDLHDLLDLTAELNEMLAKLPGVSRIKERIDEQQAASHDGPL